MSHWGTKIFSSVENGAPVDQGTFGSSNFGSSSTQERSRIEIEKRNDIVKPNISPGKHSNESQNNDDETSDKKSAEKPAAPKKEEPKVNILQVKTSKKNS